MITKRVYIIVSLLVVLSMVLAACAAPATEAPKEEAPKQEAPKEEAPKEEAKPAEGGEVTVGFVPPALTSPFHVATVDGATARTKELGWKIDVQAPASEGDNQAFVTTVQQLLEKGVKAMSINPINTDSAITAVKAANEKGVPILAHNFITPFSEGKVLTYIGYDQWGGAEKLAKSTCELIAKKYETTPDKTKGKVFILLGIESIFSHRRTGGFKAGLTKYCPSVEVVGEQTGEWLRTKGQEVAGIALQKTPDIDVFYGNSDEMAIGAALAAEEAGKVINKDFFAVGIDGNQPTLDLLKQGKFSATLGVDPYRIGVTVINTMEKILKGETTPEVLLTPSVVVTPENLEDYLAGKLWTEPVAGAPELDNDKPTVPDEGAPAAEAPAAKLPLEGKKIGFINAGPDDYYAQFGNSMRAIGKLIGAEVFEVNSDYKPEKELANVQDLIAKGVDAIAVITAGAAGSAASIKAANDANVPIFFIAGRPVVPEGGSIQGWVSDNFVIMGYMIGKYVVENYPDAKGKVVDIPGFLGQGPAEGEIVGFDMAFEEAGWEKAFLTKSSEWQRTLAVPITQDLLTSGREIKVIFACNEETAFGVVQAIEEAGKVPGKDIIIVSNNGKEEGWQLMLDGKMAATVPNPPSLNADLSLQQMIRFFNGEKYEVYLEIKPPFVLTKDNVDKAIPYNAESYLIGRADGKFEYKLDFYEAEYLKNKAMIEEFSKKLADYMAK